VARRRLTPAAEEWLLPLREHERAVVKGTGGLFDSVWVESTCTTASIYLIARRARTPEVARRKHLARPADDAGGGEAGTEQKRFGMRRRLQRLGDAWALPLSAEHLSAIGVDETDAVVLVRLEDGDPPRLVLRRVPSFDEAMQDTLMEHREALVTLAAYPDNTADEP
jgi:hypothetical protein